MNSARAICALIPALLATSVSPRLPAGGGGRERFDAFAARVASLADSAARSDEVDSVIARVRRTGTLLAEDSTVTLLYRGSARRVCVAGDPNGWDPASDEMHRIGGTDLFYLSWSLDPASRFEYKLVVDSSWILDPLNTLRAPGGFGENSEARMPRYLYPAETRVRPGVPCGRIDTTSFTSARLGRRITVYAYLPASYGSLAGRFPVLFVTDGGEYLSRAGMNVVLDNLIADGAIKPLIALFVDPRTDPGDPRTNTRMSDYALNDR
ncbi:MAG TPA: alpha/beta hydrolase-fold protein, partial [Bacteroidota bacterium]|nr:alpha/beta hydrolase-fold protein [Bacteroidota bacterium]